jgi:hypothetical protein
LPIILLAAVFRRVCPDLQVYSRTRMRSTSKWISGAFHVGVWSNPSGSGLFEGFRGRFNQSRSGSSSVIHSLIACQGGSIGSCGFPSCASSWESHFPARMKHYPPWSSRSFSANVVVPGENHSPSSTIPSGKRDAHRHSGKWGIGRPCGACWAPIVLTFERNLG